MTTLLSIERKVKKLAAKYSSGSLAGAKETQTEAALVRPFFEAFGWDTSDISVISPHVTLEDGSIPDYALLQEGDISTVIELKRVDEELEKHIPQLENYFNSSSADVGVLTNGVQYWFFSWMPKKKCMNPSPFAIVDIRDLRLRKEDRFLSYFRQSKYNAKYFKLFGKADTVYSKLFWLLGSDLLTDKKKIKITSQTFDAIFQKHIGGDTITRRQVKRLNEYGKYHSRWTYTHNGHTHTRNDGAVSPTEEDV